MQKTVVLDPGVGPRSLDRYYAIDATEMVVFQEWEHPASPISTFFLEMTRGNDDDIVIIGNAAAEAEAVRRALIQRNPDAHVRVVSVSLGDLRRRLPADAAHLNLGAQRAVVAALNAAIAEKTDRVLDAMKRAL
jgi:hypothetical protein